MKSLLEIQDKLSIARNFVEAALMACDFLPWEHSAPLAAILDAASDKMQAIVEAVEEIRELAK